MATLLQKVKTSLRVTTDVFDDQIGDLIGAALIDLGMVGIDGSEVTTDNTFVALAVTTFVQMHFGAPEEFDRLAAAYDSMKGQLWSASNYTRWDRSGD